MTRSASGRLSVYAGFASALFLVALFMGRPVLAAIGAPFAAFVVIAVVLARTPDLRVTLSLEDDRAVEGEHVAGALVLASDQRVPEVELALVLPHGIDLVDAPQRMVVTVPPGTPRVVPLELEPWRWGAFRLGTMAVRARDRFGLIAHDAVLDGHMTLRAYPRQERLRELVSPLETQPLAGDRVARALGEGIEFADLRQFVPGDRVRNVNWRVSARKGELWVNQQHPERNSDVVLFLDSFAEVRRGRDGTLDYAVRAAASLAHEYLEQRDRVGLVGFGGVVQWLLPATGRTQDYRIADALLTSEVTLSYAGKDVDVLPPRSLPPKALVVALTPLLDDRSMLALADLRGRGFDLVVVDVSPLPFVQLLPGSPDTLAMRLWPLWREALRFGYERLGVPVVEWREGEPLAGAIEEVTAFRRYARRAFA